MFAAAGTDRQRPGRERKAIAAGEADGGEIDRVAGNEAADHVGQRRATNREPAVRTGAAEGDRTGPQRSAGLKLQCSAVDRDGGRCAARPDKLKAAIRNARAAGNTSGKNRNNTVAADEGRARLAAELDVLLATAQNCRADRRAADVLKAKTGDGRADGAAAGRHPLRTVVDARDIGRAAGKNILRPAARDRRRAGFAMDVLSSHDGRAD